MNDRKIEASAISLLLILSATGSGTPAAFAGTDPQSGKLSTTASLAEEKQKMISQYRAGQLGLAEESGRKILQKAPSDVSTHYMMGNIFLRQKNIISARDQYNFCVRSDNKSAEAKMARAALLQLQKEKSTEGEVVATNSDAIKPTDLKTLHLAERLLEKAINEIKFKKDHMDLVVSHAEEFARSRIKEVPTNTFYRRMNAFAGIQAARDNEDLYVAPNYDRPLEVLAIRNSETATVERYIDDFKRQEKIIVDETLTALEKLLGKRLLAYVTPGAAPQTPAPALTSTEQKAPRVPKTIEDAFTICGITTERNLGSLKVINIATGSIAHRAGLAPGDSISQSILTAGGNLLTLTIKRGGRPYLLKLTLSPQASAQAATPAKNDATVHITTRNSPSNPPATNNQLAWERIKNSEIVFVQDMSANMRQPLGDTGLSKWDWCAGRIVDFAESLNKDKLTTFTLVQPYQFVYELYRDQHPAALRTRLAMSRALEAANITTPLINLTSEYLESHNKKPLLIMVFTDGHSERGESLEVAIKYIVEHAQNADQVRVVFFQIGDDTAGTAMLKMLDDDLVYSGLKWDVVDTVKFLELQDAGLSRALLDAYVRPRALGKAVLPEISPELTGKLNEIQKRIDGMTKAKK